MVDLGSYALYVLSGYAFTLLALAILVGAVLKQARKVRRELAEMENRR